jgi:hypothetical protein
MRSPRVVRLREPSRVTVTVADSDLDEIIQCIANAGNRAESATYDLSSTPRAGDRKGEGEAPVRPRQPAGARAQVIYRAIGFLGWTEVRPSAAVGERIHSGLHRRKGE